MSSRSSLTGKRSGKNDQRVRFSGNRKRRTRQQRIRERNRAVRLLILLAAAVFALTIGGYHLLFSGSEQQEGAPPLEVSLLTVNEYSRPGITLEQVNGIVIHYTANPGSTARNNRDYFESLKDSHKAKVSSHFVIDLDGTIVQCIPCSEIAYASNDRNADTISIECCHPDESGEFYPETYQALVELTSWLCRRYDLSADDVIRHYDVTGKLCPKYFVEQEEEWLQFREAVTAAIKRAQ